MYKQEASGIVSYSVGLVFAVYRGSISKVSASSRKLRVSKCLGICAPADAVARVLVLEMKDLDGKPGHMYTSALAPSKLLVPSLDVVCELNVHKFGDQNGVCYFSFQQSTVDTLKQIRNGEIDASELFSGQCPPSPGKEPADHKVPDCVGFTVADFPKGKDGRKNVVKFMASLPQQYQKIGIQLLNAKGDFKLKGEPQTFTWASLCARCSLFFELKVDATSTKQSPLQFSRFVYNRLREILGLA